MCGIVGIVGVKPAADRLVDALKRLEYRGYDSAGVALHEKDGVARVRAAGKIKALEAKVAAADLHGAVGIAHTRWATHGKPTEDNAHPHQAGSVVIVHNGIIENFRELRAELEAEGVVFSSETDSEVVAHMIEAERAKGKEHLEAFFAAANRLKGAFAFAVLFADRPDLMLGARKGSPLVAGLGEGENFLGSDAFAVAPMTNRVVYLEEGDRVALTADSVQIYNEAGEPVERAVTIVQGAGAAAEKGNYRHFMQKEIFEQPESTARTLGVYLDPLTQSIRLPQGDTGRSIDFSQIGQIHIVACGTAFYAGMVAEYWLEQLAGVPVTIDIASEFRYRRPVLRKNDLCLVISQSGETADTLAALRYCKEHGLTTAGVVNVETSSIAREVDVLLPTHAGPEIGVASTKAFTAQLTALACFAIAAATSRGYLGRDAEIGLVRRLTETPRLLSETLKLDPQALEAAHEISKARDVLFLGRGFYYPMALEGALKLKEISYIHAEGYAAGEIKHGPIALVDEETPIIVLAPFDGLFDKTASSMEEVAARGGRVLLISDEAGLRAAGSTPWKRLEIPAVDPFIAPIVAALPIQLLAYHTAVIKGTDADQPRNLAKSVTVE